MATIKGCFRWHENFQSDGVRDVCEIQKGKISHSSYHRIHWDVSTLASGCTSCCQVFLKALFTLSLT